MRTLRNNEGMTIDQSNGVDNGDYTRCLIVVVSYIFRQGFRDLDDAEPVNPPERSRQLISSSIRSRMTKEQIFKRSFDIVSPSILLPL